MCQGEKPGPRASVPIKISDNDWLWIDKRLTARPRTLPLQSYMNADRSLNFHSRLYVWSQISVSLLSGVHTYIFGWLAVSHVSSGTEQDVGENDEGDWKIHRVKLFWPVGRKQNVFITLTVRCRQDTSWRYLTDISGQMRLSHRAYYRSKINLRPCINSSANYKTCQKFCYLPHSFLCLSLLIIVIIIIAKSTGFFFFLHFV